MAELRRLPDRDIEPIATRHVIHQILVSRIQRQRETRMAQDDLVCQVQRITQSTTMILFTDQIILTLPPKFKYSTFH